MLGIRHRTNLIDHLVRVKTQGKESHPRRRALPRNAHVRAAAVTFLKLNWIVVQLFYRVDRRSSFQNSDFIITREGEVEAEVLFHRVLSDPGEVAGAGMSHNYRKSEKKLNVDRSRPRLR
jgi:hypothetical protein